MSPQKILFLLSLTNLAHSARILCVIPSPSFTHQVPFRPLWRELSLRGHHVTVMTTDPMNDPTLTNLTEIDLHFSYDLLDRYNLAELASDETKSVFEVGARVGAFLDDLTVEQLNLPQVQELLRDAANKFDLLIVEVLAVHMSALSWKFKCPFIGVVSTADYPFYLNTVVGNQPVIISETNLSGRLKKFFGEYVVGSIFIKRQFRRVHSLLRPYLGNDLPSLEDISNNASMIFVNSNRVFTGNQAISAKTVYIGDGIHIQPAKALPEDLQNFIDRAKNGVIYFSFGTNIHHKSLRANEISSIVDAFAELPYKVLWKFDKQDIENVTGNVRIEKWLPQQDILRHPNVKLFITQGGLQSLQEAIASYVPLVCVPFFGDQKRINAPRIVELGLGVRLNRQDVTKDSFKDAILEVIGNPKYKEKVSELAQIIQDEPMTGLEKAVWWTEYVIRHKGAKHFDNKYVEMPFYQHYLLDVLAVTVIVPILFIYIIWKIVRFILGKLSLLLFGKTWKLKKL